MAQIQTVNATTEYSKIVEIIKRDGCIVIEGLLSGDETDELQKEMSQRFEALPDCQGDVYGHETKRMGSLFSKSKTFQKMA